jgi:prepilin-type N-terminal cleavage/methylation domain-containing protein
MVRKEDGFTLVEMLVVMIVMAILLAIAVGFQTGARVRAADASAKSNIDVAIPAFQTYALDNDGYTGMTLPFLQSSYSKGVQGIEVVSASAGAYCVKSTVEGRTWFKSGPTGPITTTTCS